MSCKHEGKFSVNGPLNNIQGGYIRYQTGVAIPGAMTKALRTHATPNVTNVQMYAKTMARAGDEKKRANRYAVGIKPKGVKKSVK
jgi:hypothetical protein